ncbi:MAG: secretin N-terminal domain-containing protein [Betaproteobacteria bacterium]
MGYDNSAQPIHSAGWLVRRLQLRYVLTVLLLLCSGTPSALLAAAQVLEVITLGYRQADDVIPMLQPLLVPGGTITGMNNRLVVRTTPANMADLKRVLATVDAAPRRLMISVRQTAGMDSVREGASVSGSTNAGNARVTVPRRPGASNDPGVSVQSGRTRVDGQVISSRSARSDDVTQTVQVLEGNPALIRIGQSAPVTSTQVIRTPNGTQIIQGTQTVEADTGFYVTPRVNGDRVTLEIGTSRDRAARLDRSDHRPARQHRGVGPFGRMDRARRRFANDGARAGRNISPHAGRAPRRP